MKVEGMGTYASATAGVKGHIKQLLTECGLPSDDLSISHLQHFLVVKKDDAEIVGVVGLEVFDRVALLRSLAVGAPHRRQGLASQMIRKIESYALSIGIETLYLLTTTAEEFLLKRGYRKSERQDAPELIQDTAEFRTLCPDHAVCMIKHLHPEGNRTAG